MKRVLIAVGVLIAVFVVLSVVTATPLVGEVVTLHTRDRDGAWQTTPLWIVDGPDGTYLRAGSPESGWVVRLRSGSPARLERAGEVRDVRLAERESLREAVNEQMAAKYGWADAFIGLMGNREGSLPLRVEPGPAPAAAQ